MSTIREISQKANVSIATVSKVLNGKRGVNQKTADRILSIARELNYRPNLSARQLKSGKSRTIGIITEDLTVFNSPEIVDGIAAACEESGYHYILGNLRFNKRYGNGPRDPKESNSLVCETVNDMLSKQVDGIIYIGCHSHIVVSLSDECAPKFICAYCKSADKDVPSIMYDDKRAAYEVTELLIKKGHKNIGVLAGLADSMHAANRLLGYQEALYDNNMPYNPHLTVHGDWGRNSGFELAGQLIEAGATAIFAHNDEMASGIIDYCNLNGIVVGQDLALIGFDNREISQVTRPTLSTVSLPLFEIGQTAGRLMIKSLDGESDNNNNIVELPCAIIERESTGVYS
jgi:LacI family transcriptional regulator